MTDEESLIRKNSEDEISEAVKQSYEDWYLGLSGLEGLPEADALHHNLLELFLCALRRRDKRS